MNAHPFPCGLTRSLSRREFFHGLGAGLGTVALNALLQQETHAAPAANPLAARPSHMPAQAPRAFSSSSRGPSSGHLRPEAQAQGDGGQGIRGEGKFVSNMSGGKRYFVPSPFGFAQHGQSGLWMCDRLPHLGRMADELCVYRGLTVDSVNHPEACLHMNTGGRFGGEPAIGSWVTYGLGTENQNLPAFVVLPDVAPQGGPANWSSATACSSAATAPLAGLADSRPATTGQRHALEPAAHARAAGEARRQLSAGSSARRSTRHGSMPTSLLSACRPRCRT